jgi:hypothetical protein
MDIGYDVHCVIKHRNVKVGHDNYGGEYDDGGDDDDDDNSDDNSDDDDYTGVYMFTNETVVYRSPREPRVAYHNLYLNFFLYRIQTIYSSQLKPQHNLSDG